MASINRMDIVILSKVGDKYRICQLNNYNVIGITVCNDYDLEDTLLHADGYYLLNGSLIKGKIKDDCGIFSRLDDKNGVSPRVILAEIVSQSGRVLGYKILNKNGAVQNITKDTLFGLCASAKLRGVSFVQNGIYSDKSGVKSISCYPNKPFQKIVQVPKSKPVERVSQVNKEQNKQDLKQESKYTQSQLKELKLAKDNDVNPLLIANPKLSAEQMHIIWTSKKNKMASEYFANPKFSVEAMKFFADRLVNKKMFEDCKPLFSTLYTVPQLTELYLGIYAGIDYSTYRDSHLSSEDMYTKRIQLETQTYSKSALDVVSSKSNKDCATSFLSHRKK